MFSPAWLYWYNTGGQAGGSKTAAQLPLFIAPWLPIWKILHLQALLNMIARISFEPSPCGAHYLPLHLRCLLCPPNLISGLKCGARTALDQEEFCLLILWIEVCLFVTSVWLIMICITLVYFCIVCTLLVCPDFWPVISSIVHHCSIYLSRTWTLFSFIWPGCHPTEGTFTPGAVGLRRAAIPLQKKK